MISAPKPNQRTQLGTAIVNGYMLIAVLYCSSFSLLFYLVAESNFLAIAHLAALIILTTNYVVLVRTENYQRATFVTLTVGTFIVLSLFATGGWANTGYIWPFAYLPFAFFLTMSRSTFYWVTILVIGCILIVILHTGEVMILPYSWPVIFNFFAALAVFVVCIFISTSEIIRQQDEIQTKSEHLVATNNELNVKNQEVTTQSENLRNITNQVSTLYLEIKDSIRAARVTQQSILPSEKLIKQLLPESFILYKPKHVVGGDFYWLTGKENNIIVAAADCIGHGVSGALMSISGYHLLNNVVNSNGNLTASEILDKLNTSILDGLHQHDDITGSIHGMDIALCIIDKKRNKLQFAGGNNPLYMIRNGQRN
jgi:hypothetical protein